MEKENPSRDPMHLYSTIAHVGSVKNPGDLGQIAQYRILKQLGIGGFGVVFQAEDTQLHRLAALKVMRPDYAANEEARSRFIREAQAAAALKHDNIVTIYQVGEEQGVPFLAMELLAGKSLDEWLRPDRRATVAETLLIGKQIARALAAAHATGLIHRDIKPANLWLEAPRGRLKILDFGLARLAAGDYTQLTEDGSILGTPAFMAPEQARGDTVDHRCDLFSVGCVLYRMLAGQLPFQGASTYAVLTAIASETPRPAIDVRPEIPQRLSDVVDRLLAKKPDDRVQSAQELFDELTSIEKGTKQIPLPPPLAIAEVRPWRRSLRWIAWTVGLTAAASILWITFAALIRTSENVERKSSQIVSPGTDSSRSPAASQATDASNPAHLEPLRELNTPGEEFAASLSPIGTTLYFTRVTRDQSVSGTFRAARQTLSAPFGKVGHLVKLRQSVASRLGLVGISRSRGSGTLLMSAARDGRAAFADPKVIEELRDQKIPRSPWLSHDGLMLVFQRHDAKGDYPGNASSDSNARSEFVVTTRPSPSGAWSAPVRLPLNDDPLYVDVLNWPALTEDLLSLFFCIGDGKSAKVVYATRSNLNEPFANPRSVVVGGTPLLGRTPRYDPVTRELYVARDLATAGMAENWDLWVVKDFSIEPAKK